METPTNGFNSRLPKLGEIVIFFPNPDDSTARSNGRDHCPAIVTNIWSSITVNIKIIPDHGAMQDRGSVSHFSANIAGYHFMFQDEYEVYLRNQLKDYVEIKKQLIKESEESLSKSKDAIKKSQDLKKPELAKQILTKGLNASVDPEKFGPTY